MKVNYFMIIVLYFTVLNCTTNVVKENIERLILSLEKTEDQILKDTDNEVDVLSIKNIREKLLKYQFGKTGYLFIIDDKGFLIYHPFYKETKSLISEDGGEYSNIMKRIIEQKNGSIIEKIEGREKAFIFRTIRDTNYIMIIMLYKIELYNKI